MVEYGLLVSKISEIWTAFSDMKGRLSFDSYSVMIVIGIVVIGYLIVRK